jgi:phenylpropionate dioxygenase-like ring-hydroxylating dioxygenase large terminal subunit
MESKSVSRHRQAWIHQGRGNGEHVVCHLHDWTHGKQGALRGAPPLDVGAYACHRSQLTEYDFKENLYRVLFRRRSCSDRWHCK